MHKFFDLGEVADLCFCGGERDVAPADRLLELLVHVFEGRVFAQRLQHRLKPHTLSCDTNVSCCVLQPSFIVLVA